MSTKLRLQFGDNIRSFRGKKGLTQKALAETSGIDYKYIQRIEGKNPPGVKVNTIDVLAGALKVQPSKLLEF